MQFTANIFIIKPDGVDHLDTILKELTNLRYLSRLDRMQSAPRHLLEEHYANVQRRLSTRNASLRNQDQSTPIS